MNYVIGLFSVCIVEVILSDEYVVMLVSMVLCDFYGFDGVVFLVFLIVSVVGVVFIWNMFFLEYELGLLC